MEIKCIFWCTDSTGDACLNKHYTIKVASI